MIGSRKSRGAKVCVAAVAAPRHARPLIAAAVAAIFIPLNIPGPNLATAAMAGDALLPLQPLIDATASGAVLMPPPGRYAGPIVISRPMTLDGANKVIIDGGGKGTVVRVLSTSVTVQNVHVVNSGDQHNDIDSGIRIEGDSNVIKDNVIEGCLFGVDLQKSNSNVVRRNRITSKGDLALGVKGDAIRIWYGNENRVEDNVIDGARDLVVWYSKNNRITGNKVSNGRYGLHFMYDKGTQVENNTFLANLVGISMMYSDGIVIRNNRVFNAQGSAGTGIGFKESSDAEVTGNEVLYNAVGMAFDLSPYDPETTMRIYGNRVAFNDVGVSFLSDRPGNVFKDNIFLSNTQQVAMRLFERAASATWQGNYWDDYEGFDRDQNGTGDQPFIMRSYADRLWMDVPAAAFFKGSVALAVLDFIERLAPFSEPLKLLEDPAPRMASVFTPMLPAADKTLARSSRSPDDGEAGPGTNSEPREAGTSSNPDPDGRLDPFGLYTK